jgi:hypothetical protein
MSTRIQVRRDTTANWETTNPTLAAGEIGYDTTKKAFKIGDGTRTWTQITYQLPYLTGDAGTTPDVTTLVVDQDNDRVGIGTGTPTEKLSVTGNATVSGNIAAGGTLSVTGNTTLTGDLAVNGGDITTTSATANVVNATATTVNIGGAATTVAIGAATGTATINNSTTAIAGLLNLVGNLNINTNKFNVAASSGNTTIAGTLSAAATTLASLGLTTDLAVADGGTGASDAAGARTNLGLGSIATQDASNVAITGGAISGITDLAIADGGTGASTAAAARTNLELVSSSVTYTTSQTIDLTNVPIGQWQVFKHIAQNNSTNFIDIAVGNGENAIVFKYGYYSNNNVDEQAVVYFLGPTLNQAQNAWTGNGFNIFATISSLGLNVGLAINANPARVALGAGSQTFLLFRYK